MPKEIRLPFVNHLQGPPPAIYVIPPRVISCLYNYVVDISFFSPTNASPCTRRIRSERPQFDQPLTDVPKNALSRKKKPPEKQGSYPENLYDKPAKFSTCSRCSKFQIHLARYTDGEARIFPAVAWELLNLANLTKIPLFAKGCALSKKNQPERTSLF